MLKVIRKILHTILLSARQEAWIRRLSLKIFVKLHNFSYHMISFFSSHQGLHPKHAIMQYHKFFLEHIDPSDTVLDVGSGNGKIAFEIAHKAKFVIGVDIRPQNVELSRNQFQRHNLSFEHGDATTHNFQQDFDVIVLSNVLEHIEHRIKFLIKLSQAAPKILIRVPMLTRDWVTVHKKNLGLEYRLDDTHFTEFTLESFNHEINAAGLKIEELTVNFGEIYAVCQRS